MIDLAWQLSQVVARLHAAEQAAGRPVGSVQLLAVSKTHPAPSIRTLATVGQHCFGENYLQEAQIKLPLLTDLDLEWHFIGPLQSNKTRAVATLFHWVQSVDRGKVAQRLSDQRPPHLPPLNICLEVNVSGEASKSGVAPADLPDLARAVARLPGLRLRGLMAIPAPITEHADARVPFRVLHQLFVDLQTQGFDIDTLSMGMSDDLAMAVAEGATMVRVGTAIFGARQRMPHE